MEVELMDRWYPSDSFRCYDLVKDSIFSNFYSIGGVGTLAYALCHHHPHLKITVCDLESVVNASHHFRPSLEACPNQGNVSFAVEDFFKPDLPRADLYVLCRVLHDWPEDKIDLILSNVFNCSPSGKAFIITEVDEWLKAHLAYQVTIVG